MANLRTIRRLLLSCLLVMLPVVLSAQQLSRLYYWFDSDLSTMRYQPLSGIQTGFDGDIPTSGLSAGMHHLNLQLMRSDGMRSPVSTTVFFKCPEGSGRRMEYWFDDDYRSRTTMTISANGEMEQLLLEMKSLSSGLHWVHMRVASEGQALSNVYSTVVMKKGTGNMDRLEYWIDDDYQNRRQVSSVNSNDVAAHFLTDLDLSGLSPGMHQLNYRVVSATGNVASAPAAPVPVMVKSRYESDGSDAYVTSIGYSFDNGTPILIHVPQKQYEVEYNLYPYAQNLKAGNHQVKVVAWNSFGTSSSITQPFTVAGETKPEIHLDAERVNGMVKLAFTPAPNDIQNIIVRSDGSHERVILNSPEGVYPHAIVFYDQPEDGTYYYTAKSKYRDFQGKEQVALSPTVECAYQKPVEEVKVVDITGYIETDENSSFSGLSVKLSDDYVGAVRSNGMFLIKSVPVGGVFTPQVVGDANHDYETTSFTVAAKNAPLVLKGTSRESVQHDNVTYHLALTSPLRWAVPSRNVSFEVKNLSNRKWTGYVRAKAVPHSFFNSEENMQKKPTTAKNLVLIPSEDITTIQIDGNRSLRVELNTEVLSKNKDKEWQFYLETVGRWEGEPTEVRPLSMEESDFPKNLFSHQIEANLNAVGDDRVLDRDDTYKLALMLTRMTSQIDGLSGHVGDLTYFEDEVKTAAKSLTDKDGDEGVEAMFQQLQSMETSEVMQNQAVIKLMNSLYDRVYNSTKSYIVTQTINRMHNKYCTKLSAAIKTGADFKTVLSGLYAAYRVIREKNLHDKYFVMADWMANTASTANPFLGMIITDYVVLSKAIIKKILEIGGVHYKSQQVLNLHNNKLVPLGSDDPQPEYVRFNNCMDFRIRVKGKKGWFTPQQVKEQIRDVRIVAHDNLSSIGAEEYFDCKAVTIDADETDEMKKKNKDFVMVQQISNGTNSLNDNTTIDLFMLISWANGVVTKVPLLEKDEGNLEFDAGHGTADITGMNLKYKPSVYTITFRSNATEPEQMADDMNL